VQARVSMEMCFGGNRYIANSAQNASDADTGYIDDITRRPFYCSLVNMHTSPHARRWEQNAHL